MGVARFDRARTGACVLALALALLVALASCSRPPKPPPPPPGPTQGAGMLAGWQLTLPVPGSSGNADIVKPARVSPPWLTTDADGNLVFWAPVNGVTTKNSEHARTELVRLDGFEAGRGEQTLNASVAVTQEPAEGVIIGQIHGGEDISSVPFVMLFHVGGVVRAVVKQEQSGNAHTDYPLLSDVPLGARFDYGIHQNADGSLTITATYDGNTVTANAPLPADFAGASVRFQAGAYQQASSEEAAAAADAGARVTFYSVTTGPGPAPAGS